MNEQDTRIAELIEQGLQTGFVHPGDESRNIPPTPIVLPFKPSPGMPQEMAKLMQGTAKLLSECIVSLIHTEGQCEIVPVADALTMRAAVGQSEAVQMMPVFCHCNSQEPLAFLTITQPGRPDRFVIDGRMFIRGLSKRAVQCPHSIDGADELSELRAAINELIDELPKRDVSTKARALLASAIARFEDKAVHG